MLHLKIKKGIRRTFFTSDPQFFYEPLILPEQSCDFLRDSGDNSIVEEQRQSSQKQGAQYHGDDDLNSIRDVKVAALVEKSPAGTGNETVVAAFDKFFYFFHGNLLIMVLVVWLSSYIDSVWQTATKSRCGTRYRLLCEI